MSNIYGTAERASAADGPVTYTPRAATVAAAARGDLWEQDILDVEDLVLAGLAKKCGGRRWHFEHGHRPYATLLSPAGGGAWHMDGTWRVEVHLG